MSNNTMTFMLKKYIINYYTYRFFILVKNEQTTKKTNHI